MLLPSVGGLEIGAKRAMVVQQSADCWMRVDCYWESSPRSTLSILTEDAAGVQSFWNGFENKELCCHNASFDRTLQTEYSAEERQSSDFKCCMKSIDQDDSAVSAIEVIESEQAPFRNRMDFKIENIPMKPYESKSLYFRRSS